MGVSEQNPESAESDSPERRPEVGTFLTYSATPRDDLNVDKAGLVTRGRVTYRQKSEHGPGSVLGNPNKVDETEWTPSPHRITVSDLSFPQGPALTNMALSSPRVPMLGRHIQVLTGNMDESVTSSS